MRSTLATSLGTTQYFQDQWDTGNWVRQWEKALPQTTFSLLRSEITRVKRDSTGWRSPTSYTSEALERSLSGTYFEGRFGTPRRKYEGALLDFMPGRPSPPDVSSGLRSRTEVAALLKLKDMKVNLAQFYAERKMTEKLAFDTMETIAEAGRAVARRDPKGVAKALGLTKRGPGGRAWNKLAPMNRWLEYQYAWSPLLNDVYGAQDALLKEPRDSMRFTVRSKQSDRDPVSETGENLGSCPVKWTGHKKAECKVALTYIPSVSMWNTIASCGLTNPLLLQWELVPFSFVADWFIPIGNWLNAMDATAGFEFYAGSRTHYCEAILEAGDLTLSGARSVGVRGFSRNVIFNRYVYGSSPFPTLPSFRPPWAVNGANRFANAMSLLTTVFGGGSPRR